MTSSLIQVTLAQEFSVSPEQIGAVLSLLDAGLSATYIGRVRRREIGELSEGQIRRLDRLRRELEELDRRRGTILRLLEKTPGVTEAALAGVRTCMDRYELEDLFLPHRRPEMGVQEALDRGLGALAELLVAPVARPPRASEQAAEPALEDLLESDLPRTEPEQVEPERRQHDQADREGARQGLQEPVYAEHGLRDPDQAEFGLGQPAHAEPAGDSGEAHEQPTSEEIEAAAEAALPAAIEAVTEEGADLHAAEPAISIPPAPESRSNQSPGHPPGADAHMHDALRRLELTLHLARICRDFVKPDRGVHSDQEALSGALRILADRLGRNPRLRGTLRRMLRREGLVSVRATVDEARLGRHKPVLRIKTPLRQLQGPRLIALRQAQRERLVAVSFALDRQRALSKMRQALGARLNPDFKSALDLVTEQAFDQRLLPMIEEEVRLELKEHGDEEVLRSVCLHLRQVLLTPPYGELPVAGVDVNAKGDWTLAVLDAQGIPRPQELRPEVVRPEEVRPEEVRPEEVRPEEVRPEDVRPEDVRPEDVRPEDVRPEEVRSEEVRSEEVRSEEGRSAEVRSEVVRSGERRIELRNESGEKDDQTLGAELAQALSGTQLVGLAVAHGRLGRAAPPRLRAALAAAGLDIPVFLVNECGLVPYANSELARKELPGLSVPMRMAVSLGRRLQDPLRELVKVDPRHLGLGPEIGLVAKGALRRALAETVESAVAYVGCDPNKASESLLRLVPGLDAGIAAKLVARRAEKPFESRAELRQSGVFTDPQWASAAASLRLPDSPEPLDATGLHPEQYELAQRILAAAGEGGSAASPGRLPGARNLRREDFDVDEDTWRDLGRELMHPGREPRLRLYAPRLLPPDTDPKSLSKDQVVEGLVSNVTGFAAFVDIGLGRDALIHISELSDRYVRDAREMLSIGQWVRGRVVDTSGQRVALSLKNVPMPPRQHFERGGPRPAGQGEERRPEHSGRRERPAGARGGDGRGDGRGAGEGRGAGGGRGGAWRGRERGADSGEAPRESHFVRAAQSRRDGAVVGGGGRRGGKGGGKGREGGGERGGERGAEKGAERGGRGPRGAREARDVDYDPQAVRERSAPTTFKPFASFFKKGQAGSEAGSTS